jgi:hypothetical protein
MPRQRHAEYTSGGVVGINSLLFRCESVLEALRPLGGEVAFGCRCGHVASGRALRAAAQ